MINFYINNELLQANNELFQILLLSFTRINL